MLYKQETSRLQDVISYTIAGNINPDPIGQRPPVQTSHKKAQAIIDSILRGFSVGAITVRDITHDAENQLIYPGVKWLVIDGGNRIRAIRDFHAGRFPTLDGKTYLTLTDEERKLFEDTVLYFFVYECSNVEATEIFRRLNTVTPVNQIEMIMANDISSMAKNIRTRVKSYKEYGYNTILELFSTKAKQDGTLKSTFWSSDINPRRKWDEYVGVAYLKSIGGGNVNAGLDKLEELVETDPSISSDISKVVDRFFYDIRMTAVSVNKKLNSDIFAAFQTVWFGLYEKNKVFTIKNHTKFAHEFFKAHAILTGNSTNDYDNEVRQFSTGERGGVKNKTETVRSFARAAITNFANPAEQHEVAQLYLEEMDITGCVLFRDERRTISKDQKFDILAQQGFVCAIDGEPLDITDAIFGHDTAWAHGGQIEDGAIIRKVHNVNMGTTTIDEYRMILELRKTKELA